MALELYESHGILCTEVPNVVSEEIIPAPEGTTRVYEYGFPSSVDERDDITAHTDVKYITRKPSISQESEIITFVVDFREDYLNYVDRISVFEFTFVSADYTTQPTWSNVELKVTLVEPNDSFVASDGSAKKMTITCEVQNDFTITAGS